MGSPRAASILLVLAVLAALGLSACGGSDAKLLPGKTASEINSNLDQVRTLVAEEDCVGAENAVGEVSEEVDNLGGVDKKLKAALRQGTTRLREVVVACREEAEQELTEEREVEEKAERAEQREQEAVEAEEDELAEEKEQQRDEKAEEKAKKEAEKEKEKAPEDEQGEEGEETTPPGEAEGIEKGKGPPAETPGGAEPPAGGVGPGSQVE